MPVINFFVGSSSQLSPSINLPTNGNITIPAWAASTVVQGTWSFNTSTGQWATMTYANTGAQNDELDYVLSLSPGTYTISVLGVSDSDKGIITAYFDTTSLGTMDFYSAGNVKNVTKSITGIVVATSSLATLKLKVATKNVASSSYVEALTAIIITRTA